MSYISSKMETEKIFLTWSEHHLKFAKTFIDYMFECPIKDWWEDWYECFEIMALGEHINTDDRCSYKIDPFCKCEICLSDIIDHIYRYIDMHEFSRIYNSIYYQGEK